MDRKLGAIASTSSGWPLKQVADPFPFRAAVAARSFARAGVESRIDDLFAAASLHGPVINTATLPLSPTPPSPSIDTGNTSAQPYGAAATASTLYAGHAGVVLISSRFARAQT